MSVNLVGQRFGSLTVVEPARKSARVWVKCSCGSKGAKFCVANARLLDGRTKHCQASIHAKRDEQQHERPSK